MRGDQSRQAGRGAATGDLSQLRTMLQSTLRELMGGDPSLIREKIEALYGDRGGNPAVRSSEVQTLLQLPAGPTSKAAAGATPTKAEFDLLISDVHAIYAAFNALRTALERQQ